jgi:phosphate transport system substrate-binding protein
MRRIKKLVVATATLLTSLAIVSPSAVLADAPVDGAGSTWSQIAVDQWRADVARQGIVINFQGVGSTAGRAAYYQGQVDFAVSEIPFQAALVDRNGNVAADETASAASRPYAYLPIVAGGTAFMYNLKANGQKITDLQLSPATLGKIFSGQISMWNDPAIVADNPQRVMPATRIKPVIRSDGSGTSAQFTAYLASQAPDAWSYVCQQANLASGCAPTSLYPDYPSSGFAAQQYSDGVANYVAAPYNEGAITYVEYGYAKERGFPVASVKNASGAYTQPVAINVTVALLGARINDDGTQVLSGVYSNSDARTYPVSSYSYMIIPTSEASPFSSAKGATLSDFIFYFLCAGQQKAEQLGYAPLPKNLVEYGFAAAAKIPGAVAAPGIDSCANPTITGDFLVTKTVATTAAPGGTTAPGKTPGATLAPGVTTTVVPGSETKDSSDPTDGAVVDAAPVDAAPPTPGVAMATSVVIEESGSGTSVFVYLLIMIAILLIVFLPPIIAARRRPSIKI